MKRAFFVLIFLGIVKSMFSNNYKEKDLSKRYLYFATHKVDYEWVNNHMKAGFSPNKCRGDAGWVDSNPLKVLVEVINSNEIKTSNGTIQSDIAVFDLLIQYGADINQLPYVWDRIYRFNNEDFELLARWHKNNKIQYTTEIQQIEEQKWVSGVNRLLKQMLQAGADPNMKGHPFPFGYSRRLLFFTDKKAFRYCNSPEATTPLYEAIKKGMRWESQVDLLLEYGATLDDSCLEAAKLSGEQEMIEKIEKLLSIQK